MSRNEEIGHYGEIGARAWEQAEAAWREWIEEEV